MKECRKLIMRRLNETHFITGYFCDEGLGIGGVPLFTIFESQKIKWRRLV